MGTVVTAPNLPIHIISKTYQQGAITSNVNKICTLNANVGEICESLIYVKNRTFILATKMLSQVYDLATVNNPGYNYHFKANLYQNCQMR